MAPTRPVYCTEEAIRTHLGQNVKFPPNMTFDSLRESSANELDSKLGARYVTPIVASASDPVQQPTAYWLQNVSSMIAAGRFMLSTSAPGSQDTANNYGMYLLNMANAAISEVLTGQRDLVGIAEQGDTGQEFKGPAVINGDAYSQVDLYYDNFMPCGFAPGRKPAEEGTWPR